MGSTWVKIAVSVALVVGVAAIVSATAGEEAGAYRWIHEIDPLDKNLQGKTIWLAGDMVRGTHKVKRVVGEREKHRFVLTKGGKSIEVAFVGTVPPRMNHATQIVVRGKLDGKGGFIADQVTTKCPSKYKSKPPTE